MPGDKYSAPEMSNKISQVTVESSSETLSEEPVTDRNETHRSTSAKSKLADDGIACEHERSTNMSQESCDIWSWVLK